MDFNVQSPGFAENASLCSQRLIKLKFYGAMNNAAYIF